MPKRSIKENTMALCLGVVLPLGLIVSLLIGLRADEDSSLRRLTPSDIAGLARGGAGAGTAGVAGIQTTVLSGDPAGPGLNAIRLSVPANTRIEAHDHRDDRSATVVSGTWYFGYGPRFDEGGLKVLPPGTFYTEPKGLPHFAQTRAGPVVVYITGYGPTNTTYVDKAADPRKP